MLKNTKPGITYRGIHLHSALGHLLQRESCSRYRMNKTSVPSAAATGSSDLEVARAEAKSWKAKYERAQAELSKAKAEIRELKSVGEKYLGEGGGSEYSQQTGRKPNVEQSVGKNRMTQEQRKEKKVTNQKCQWPI
jgi:hypothetical protein